VDEGAREWLAKHGYSQMYGARAIARVVRTDVLFPMAQKLLRGTIRDGDMVVIRVKDDKLDIKDNHPSDAGAMSTASVDLTSNRDI